MKRFTLLVLSFALSLAVSAVNWTTHFAYNSIDQITAGNGVVYCVSSGALIAVDAQSEQIRTFSNQDGMHGSNIACVQWLNPVNSLLIIYADGKMDMLHNGTFHYIPDLYIKNVTFSKLCHSVTVRDSLAYMAMDYGVQTFHMRKREFVDTYFIGAKATEVPVYSIAFTADSIYAAAETSLYTASLNDNLMDYVNWRIISVPKSSQIQGVAAAGGVLYLLQGNTCYRRSNGQWQAIDNNSYKSLNVIDGTIYPAQYPTVSCDGLWLAAGAQGLIRQMESGEQITYQLDGPLNNNPYRLHFDKGRLYMLAGSRWSAQDKKPGNVMCYDGSSWRNITEQEIVSAVGKYCMDMMNAAVDPTDSTHFFITSYGTGLYEFRDDQCIKRWNKNNSIIGSAAASNPDKYTRTDGAIYDAQNNLWVLAAGGVEYNIVIFTPQGEQIGMNLKNADGSKHVTVTPAQILFDNQRPNRVWVLNARGSEGASVGIIDTQGTLANTDDDFSIGRTRWTDPEGNTITTTAGYVIRQDVHGNILFGNGNGLWMFPATADYASSDLCIPVQLTDLDGNVLFEDEAVNDIRIDDHGRIWLAGSKTGVYVITPEMDAVVAHFSTDNSSMPSNTVLSLAYDVTNKRMYVGTSLGLVACTDISEDLNAETNPNNELIDLGTMMQWTTHFAYTDIEDLQLADRQLYALSEGALCAIDKQDESIQYYSKLNGLNGSSIHRIAYDGTTNALLVAYDDGLFDLIRADGEIKMIADLYLKQMNTPKQLNDVVFHEGKAYLAMPFGIVALNMKKHEVSDTYYIGDEGAELDINAVTIYGDSIYAAAENILYRAHMRANLVDYAQWQNQTMPDNISQLITCDEAIYMLMGGVLYRNYQPLAADGKFSKLTMANRQLIAYAEDGRLFAVNNSTLTELSRLATYAPHCVIKEGSAYWLGTKDGVLRVDADGSTQKFQPDGPSSNMPYSLTSFGNELWGVPGGRWASGYLREGQIMYFNGTNWDNLTYDKICQRMGGAISIYDLCHVAVDPANPAHFFAASYGTGLLEFMPNGKDAKRYNHDNSALESLSNDKNRYRYCRVDAIAFDAERNLWLTNMGNPAINMHVIDPQGGWHSFNLYNGSQRIVLTTVSKILMDNRNPNYKWIAHARAQAGLILLNDGGTPYSPADDRVMLRSTFVDQDKKSITIDRLGTIAQDYNGDLWLGTSEGILILDAATDFFRSAECRRLKISRHDGTNLADYLLGTEQINAIVFAGGNRIWIGTEVSGVYLVHMVTKEGIYEPEILAHFTSVNSPMPSDCVLSLAVNPENGEVYIGTSKGLVSYRGDATEPSETFSDAYVYPNPVRPNYEGVITVNGLMDNTTVYIADAAGNVVCRTHSNGGTAVWDGKTQSGKKAHSGVYTIYCNTADGKQHHALKVLLMH